MWTLVLSALAFLVVGLVTMAVNGLAFAFILRWFPPVRGRRWISVVFFVVCVMVAFYWNMMLWLGIPAFGVSLKPMVTRLFC